MTEELSVTVSTWYSPNPWSFSKKKVKTLEKEHQPLFMSPFMRYCLLIPSWLCDIVFVCVAVPLSKLEEKK